MPWNAGLTEDVEIWCPFGQKSERGCPWPREPELVSLILLVYRILHPPPAELLRWTPAINGLGPGVPDRNTLEFDDHNAGLPIKGAGIVKPDGRASEPLDGELGPRERKDCSVRMLVLATLFIAVLEGFFRG